MEDSMSIKKFKCLRCKREWFPRKDGIPKVCPKCHSPYWNIERKAKLMVWN
jgi:Zn finger protein HypA/HybF involved in hydrogenase expression